MTRGAPRAARRGAALRRCRIPDDLDAVRSRGRELPAGDVGLTRDAVEGVWRAAEALYRCGVHPAIQLCIRYRGQVVLERAIGHAAGNAPDDPPDAPLVPLSTETPINAFSAVKPVTAMLIHKLDERRALHLEDRVCEFIPEFARHGKERITLRHLLAHRAGIPHVAPEAMDPELLRDPERVLALLCDARPRTRPGRLLAYHPLTGGFVLAEVVRRVTGRSIRELLGEVIAEPLGLRWMRYGARAEDAPRVARNACTGPEVPLPARLVLRRALGVGMRELVALSNDPRFLTAVVPSGNLITTAGELALFYQCLLEGGALGGTRLFEPRTVRHATQEQSYREIDLTLHMPVRYGLGFMLGSERLSLLGWDNPQAFGHLGFTNIYTWADPERALAVALLTTGKPVLGLYGLRLVGLLAAIHRAFPRLPREDRARGAGDPERWSGRTAA